MPRTKGSKNHHHKEKPHKEPKQRGRPKGSIKQKQHQTLWQCVHPQAIDSLLVWLQKYCVAVFGLPKGRAKKYG